MLFKQITIFNENFDIDEKMFVGIKDAKIDYIGKEKPKTSYGEEYDGKNRLLMPGFYNTHAHSPMALMRGYGENLALQDWLNQRIFPFEDKLDSNAVYWGTMLCMAESLRYGIVSSTDMYYFIPDMVKAVAHSGCKNNLSRSIVNIAGEDFEKMVSVEEMKTAINEYNNIEEGRIKIDASLHAEYTSDEKTVRALAEYAKKSNVNMHVHISETKAEHEECKARHNQKTPVQYLNDCGLLDQPTTAAHCVWIEDEDFDILKKKNVTVATNPVSNLKLASGVCNVPKLLEKGIRVGIGTDSVASNNNLNFFEEIKTMSILGKVRINDPTVITPKQALTAATYNGALSQGREDCGKIKEGYKADLMVLRTDVPNMHPVHNLLNNVVYSTAGDGVILTMVDGKVLYENGEYKTIDIEKTIFETENATNKILMQL